MGRWTVPAIGIRQLKEQTSEIVRRVREESTTFDVTYRGRIVARLVPVKQSQDDRAASLALLDDLDRLAAELAWPEGVSAVEVVRDVRREL
jgi:prevent-host-death family protein